MTYRQDGKKWTLPDVVEFEGHYRYNDVAYPKFTYEVVGYRKPLKGEYYLSGAIPQAYLAPNDLSTEYLVVRKKEKMVLRQLWVPERIAKLNGEEVFHA
jgi:hypothetical protein